MALRVWLPLNGSVENKGISGVGLIQKTTPTYVNNGKIGKALSAGAFTLSATDTASILNNEEISFCFWIYPNAETGDTTNRARIFGNEGMTAPNNRKFSIFQYPTCNDLHLSWQNDITNTTFLGGVWNGVFPSYKWTHCAITYSKKQGKATIYINGEQYSAANGVSNSPSFEFETYLMSNGGTFRYLNDYRIYDHCLSPKEVKKISQGLMLHYKLDGWSGGAGENLLANSMPLNSLNWWSHAGTNWSTSIVDCDITSSGKCVRCTYTGTTKVSGGIHHPPIDWNSMEDGEVYTLSAYIRASKSCTITFKNEMMSSASSGTFTPTVTQSWQRYEVSGPINKAATYHSNVMYVVTSEAEQNMWIEACMMKLEKGSTSTSWTLTSSEFGVDTTKVTDSSGYGHDGTILSNPYTNSDADRYQISTYFDGVDDGILIENLTLSSIINDQVSYSFWIKPNGENGARSVYFGSYSSTSWSIEKTAGNVLKLYWNGSPDETCSGATITDGIWQHIVVTKSGTNNIKVYINGVQKWTSTAAHNTLSFPTTYRIGRDTRSGDGTPYHGLMSDFRIYATALSAEDISDLYHTSANIDNEKRLHSFEFVEDDGNIVDEQGLVHSGLLSSDSDLIKLLYDKKLHVEPDGSVWAHIYHHNRPDLGSFASTNDFANSVKIDDNRWFNASEVVNSFSSEWEFLIIYNFTQGGTVYKERWIQTKNPETAVFGDVDAADITRVTGGEYKTGTWGGLYKKNGSAYWVMNNGTNGNWWGATGSFSIYQGGIPGYGGTITTTGCNDLYIRIDRFSSTPTQASIGRGSVYTFNDFIEK